MTREELLSKLCAATEGSEELNASITAWQHRASLRPYPPPTDFGPQARWQFWSLDGQHFIGNESKWPVYDWTRNVEFALKLVPASWFVSLERFSDGWYATVSEISKNWPTFFVGVQKPAALALCIAAIKAEEQHHAT